MSRKKGEPATFAGSSFGQLVTVLGDDDVVTGTFDNDGKLSVKGNMDNPNYVGFWTASTAPTECDTEKNEHDLLGQAHLCHERRRPHLYRQVELLATPNPTTPFEAKWDGK